MPGSGITAKLEVPYVTPWSFSENAGGGSGTWADSTNNTFTVPASPNHPFVTGDVMYVRLWNGANILVTPMVKYYAIVISATQLKYASSYANAIAGTALTIPSALSTVLGIRSGIGNHPNVGYNGQYDPNFYNPATWMASSVSTISFASTEKIQIDFTFSNPGEITASLFTKSLSYICGFYQSLNPVSIVGEGNATNYTIGNALQNNMQAVPPVARFTLQNRRVSIAIRLNDGTYLTRFTGSVLATNLDPLFFAVNMGINGYNANNCTITYL